MHTNKLSKKALSLLLTLAMLCGLMVTSAFAAGGTWAGSGTAADPYQIADAADLATLATNVEAGNSYSGVYFELTASFGTASGWAGIGNPTVATASSSSPYVSGGTGFAGTFDGNGMTITVSRAVTASGGGGLFNYVAPGGVVKDLTVAGTVTGSGSVDAVGGVVGYNSGTINKVTNNATVSAGTCYNVGGVAGFNNGYYGATGAAAVSGTVDGVILNCVNSGAVTGKSKAGGIAGENAGLIASCSNSGAIENPGSGKNGAGGIAGRNGNNNTAVETGVIRNCYNTGNITVNSGKWAGGICGFENSKSTSTNCYNTGNITGNSYLDHISGNTEGVNTNCYGLIGVGAEEYDGATQMTAAAMTATTFVSSLKGSTSGIWVEPQTAGSYPVLTRTEQADGTSGGGGTTQSEIYLGGAGASDTNDGTGAADAVATLSKAVELAGNETATIYVLGTVAIGSESIFGNSSITVQRYGTTTAEKMFTVSGTAVVAGLTVNGAGFDTTFSVADGGYLSVRNNADISGSATAIAVASGGALQLNRSSVSGTGACLDLSGTGTGAYPVCTMSVNTSAGQKLTLSGTVNLGAGAYLTMESSPRTMLTNTLSVQSDVMTAGTVIAVGTSEYSLTASDRLKLSLSGGTLSLSNNQIVIA